MPADVFIDTNILVYAHDLDAGEKHEKAKELVRELWDQSPAAWLSVQVLQELFVNLVRKGVESAEARELVNDYMHWRVVETTVALLTGGLDEQERWNISLWDGLILAAARSAAVKELWSEDLNEGQDYDGIVVVNPLK